ncbi:MAG: hypothetical protein A3A98_00305 [Candidatus Staskawiczbacteria bacterium RIFCSPLOWO2_01_FULL_40_39]|uniref:Uncharacterized protein n=1 Tax=Candidatus Staskawiczbacteria bacterium RIFCSPHIGHO2_01_FULL_39_25 TaxID=1802202 RepID=A0A1G2HN61_9BACT|nr:MAG: hypothetical protein A2730_00305 [Candidatus Staskawiczbacteria bacterium RIFCSPHIGHO2_01_FULL_39_25]OGZ73177.1 MAG: hypothetical protein A3A98_00305 [Candidatus Staskawiczbacteria bacterium RIFCSPLOWO2_01_FULL_40_39]OGZ75997.1 MAG: hypothetical protein A3I87_01485 [Candidatus Staskawiczbacteria bacterium RIFCSPLOWO2_02_FULL_39_8]
MLASILKIHVAVIAGNAINDITMNAATLSGAYLIESIILSTHSIANVVFGKKIPEITKKSKIKNSIFFCFRIDEKKSRINISSF